MSLNPDDQSTPRVLHMVVDQEIPGDQEAFSDSSRRWLGGAVTALAADAIKTVAVTPLPSGSLTRHRGPFGPPGTPWGSLVVRANPRRSNLRAWSEDSWKAFLKAADSHPEESRVALSTLDRLGQPGGGHLYEFSVTRLRGDRWMRLQGRYHPPRDATVEWNPIAARWSDFLTDFVETSRYPPAFGCVMDDTNGEPCTPLEQSLRLDDKEVLDASLLRGYSWTTVISPPLAKLCGGVNKLERFGFAAVQKCPNGAVVIRATEDLGDYGPDEFARLFRAVRPALPAGEPLPSRSPGAIPRKLVHLDAASNARSGA